MSYDTKLQPFPVCPACGHEHRDAWEWNFGGLLDGETEHDCDNCGNPMFCESIVTIEYTTRKVKPTTEGAITAKCQRIESSGEICGLTPPCPDCGSSLIDVPEGE